MILEKTNKRFFEKLCADYYEKVLRYLFSALKSEDAARDCVQEVFLTACQKRSLLCQHPNPGGFLFQTAKNLALKARRESCRRLMSDIMLDDMENKLTDGGASIESALDKTIDEHQYIEDVLSGLSDEKRRIYSFYYVDKKSMAEIAEMLGAEEPAVRMRYVRLRREIRSLVSKIAEERFI